MYSTTPLYMVTIDSFLVIERYDCKSSILRLLWGVWWHNFKLWMQNLFSEGFLQKVNNCVKQKWLHLLLIFWMEVSEADFAPFHANKRKSAIFLNVECTKDFFDRIIFFLFILPKRWIIFGTYSTNFISCL